MRALASAAAYFFWMTKCTLALWLLSICSCRYADMARIFTFLLLSEGYQQQLHGSPLKFSTLIHIFHRIPPGSPAG